MLKEKTETTYNTRKIYINVKIPKNRALNVGHFAMFDEQPHTPYIIFSV